jgi:dTDP-4-dehydrorhamnose 3,5-epimerase
MTDEPLFTPLRCIPGLSGAVLLALKRSDPGFAGFGEAYFSEIHGRAIKNWRQHTRVTVNLVAPVGAVRVVVREAVGPQEQFREFHLARTPESYARLTIPPGLWFAFQGLAAGANLLLSIIDDEHDPSEANTCELSVFPYEW